MDKYETEPIESDAYNHEQRYEQEFDRLYEGKVAERVLDDDLPNFRDNWIAERMAEARVRDSGFERLKAKF